MKTEDRTAPFCEKCERPLRNDPTEKRRPPEDAISPGKDLGHTILFTHDGCGGNVVASWRSIQPS